MMAVKAAGDHTFDFEKRIYPSWSYCTKVILLFRSELKKQEKLRVEGKEYIVKDGDVMHFRFNV
jgi:ribosome-binding ATPase YchF (GTP1/OBG family)